MNENPKESGHWYSVSGEPKYQIEKSDGSGLRNTTLRDARKLNLLPSVTTIIKTLACPALTQWLIRNAIEAALTTPRKEGESIDDFASRVLDVDSDSISDAAKQRGTEIHGLIEKALSSHAVEYHPLAGYVRPVLDACKQFGTVHLVEKTCVGQGYAGKLDACFSDGNRLTVVDFKTCSKLPKAQYDEHRLQLAAYAATFGQGNIQTANIYIDSMNPGKVATFIDTDWADAYSNGFVPLTKLWQFLKGYSPIQ